MSQICDNKIRFDSNSTNFESLEVVYRVGDTQLQVTQN